jgi:hypothetical protein
LFPLSSAELVGKLAGGSGSAPRFSVFMKAVHFSTHASGVGRSDASPRAQSLQIESIDALTFWWSMIFSENRLPPIGSKPEGKLFRIML